MKFSELLPNTITPGIKKLAIASLVSQILIVITGGAVRLTSSGLGCPTWPQCTTESLVNTPAMGIHGIIEFGNRTLTGFLTIIALAMVVSVWNVRSTRKDLWKYSLLLLLGIPAQAGLGGITVLTKLNPWVVGLHFILSMLLISCAVLLVNRVYTGVRSSTSLPFTIKTMFLTLGLCGATAIILGTMVTGSGPHAGDQYAPRNGLDSLWVTRFHTIPVYMMITLTLYAIFLLHTQKIVSTLRQPLFLLLGIEFTQGIVGYSQHFLHVPAPLVALHILGAALLTASLAYLLDVALTQPSSS